MNILDKFLEDRGLKYQDLNREEKDFYLNSQKQIEQKPPTIHEQVEQLEDMLDNLLFELIEVRTKNNKDTFLKARVKNLLIIKASLTNAERAKKQLQRLLERQS